jgi:phosphoribosyl 1,2-cyclic phosphodiesterase
MIEICALASGSNGNCYYIGNSKDAILVDAGITTKQILNRMLDKGLDPAKIRAVFITHEHGDHIRGVRVLGKKLDIPVYMTKGTYHAAFKTWKPISFFPVYDNIPLSIGSFTVYPVLKSHDATEPTSFRVEHSGINIGVFTDIGEPCENVKQHVSQCHALFLETNYDELLLKNGSYPYHLKVRIDSVKGHLSNKQAFQLLEQHAHPQLQCVFLSHISAENNRPEVAYELLKPFECRFPLMLTTRWGASDLFTLLAD